MTEVVKFGKRIMDQSSEAKTAEVIFENLPEILRPDAVANLLSISVQTVYDWQYRQKTRRIPEDLFIKMNRLLYVRTTALKRWITAQNSYMT